MKKCPVCNSSKYAYSSITGIWFCRRCKFKNAKKENMSEKQWKEYVNNTQIKGEHRKPFRIVTDKFGIQWYIDESLEGTTAYIMDKGER